MEERSALGNGRSQNIPWVPTYADWESRSVDLSSLLGETTVRVAFVFTSRNGNNIYLDNIEFFVAEPPPLFVGGPISVYPVPADLNKDDVRINFNLREKETVLIEVIDPAGKILLSQLRENVLNQTYQLLSNSASAGVYIVRVKTKRGVYTRRAIVVK
jgi:hypothetical protein